MTTLVRPETVLSAPALAFVGVRRDRRSVIIAALIATATCLAVVAPWTIRNAIELHGFAFVSTNGGRNLAVGSSPHATGRFEPLTPSDGCTGEATQIEEDRCFRDRALSWIAADPVRYAGLAPKKLGYTFDHLSFPVGYYAVADPARWPDARIRATRFVLTYASLALLFVAALGALSPLDRHRRASRLAYVGVVVAFAVGIFPGWKVAWPLAIWTAVAALARSTGPSRQGAIAYAGVVLGALLAVHVVFFGEDRYQIIVTPLFAVLAAGAFSKLPDDNRDARDRTAV